MSKADKMFEELGYEKDFLITYTIIPQVYKSQIEITFNSIDKKVEIKHCYFDKLENFYSKRRRIQDMDKKIRQAINMKCKELGWNV